MTTLSHLSLGYLVGRWFISRYPELGNSLPFTYFVAIGSANFPDIDVPLFRKISDHRDSPFHYPFTWWVAYMTALVGILLTGHTWLLPYVTLSLIGVASHLLLDTFGVNAGICWLAPFFNKEYSFIRIKSTPKRIRTWVSQYLNHWIMILELAVWIIGATAFVRFGWK